jgi:hypothetical protein
MKMRMGRRMNTIAMLPDRLVSAETKEGGPFRASAIDISRYGMRKISNLIFFGPIPAIHSKLCAAHKGFPLLSGVWPCGSPTAMVHP